MIESTTLINFPGVNATLAKALSQVIPPSNVTIPFKASSNPTGVVVAHSS